MILFTHALEPQSNYSIMPQNGKKDVKKHYLGSCNFLKLIVRALRKTFIKLLSAVELIDLLRILCPVFPAIESFYHYAFSVK